MVKAKRKSPQQLRQETIDKVVVWIAQQTPQSVKDIEYSGSLNRTKVSAEAGVHKRAINGQNAEATRLLIDFENQLRKKGLLPQKTAKTIEKESNPRRYDPNDKKLMQANSEISDLQKRLVEAEAKLRRFEEFAHVIDEDEFYDQ